MKAPEWTVTTSVDLSHELADASEAAFRLDYTVYSRIFHDVANSPIIADDGYGLLNARLSYALPGKRVILSVFRHQADQHLVCGIGQRVGRIRAGGGKLRPAGGMGVSADFRF
ncbi:hypothetical protein [Sphingomonas sp.]|uniref:hypothetical protein n=1 Tax=Sphingomonas sp. TaxID=28214 RepID=UPI002EDB1F9B